MTISTTVMSKLSNKSWDLLEDNNKTSVVFKPNNQIHYIARGISTIIKYEFVPTSKTIITYYQNYGQSFHLRYLDNDALIMHRERDGEDLCFSNRNGNNAPRSKNEAYRCMFSKHMEYISYYAGTDYNRMISCVDEVVDELDDDEKIIAIDVFRKFLNGFNSQYIGYLGFYCKQHEPDFNEKDALRILSGYIKWYSTSKAIDHYIATKNESIRKYVIMNK